MNRVLRGAIALLYAGCILTGILLRTSYTDITAEPDFIKKYKVAALTEELSYLVFANYEKDITKEPYVLIVTPCDSPQYQFRSARQRVTVKRVIEGEELECGDTIYVAACRWQFHSSDQAVDLGFVNIMQEGREYLVFLNCKAENDKKESEATYLFQDDYIVRPIFCIDNSENIPIKLTSKENTYISYDKYQNNEFFGETEQCIQQFLTLKKQLLAHYRVTESPLS